MDQPPRTGRLSASPTDSNWFACSEERRAGPFSTREIQTKLVEESLHPGDFVWRAGMADWQPISEVELFHPDLPIRPPEPLEIREARPTYSQEVPFVKKPPEVPTLVTTPSRRRAPLALFGIAALGIAGGYSLTHSQRKPLPFIPDISAADERELVQIASLPRRGRSPIAAIALAQTNPGQPSFYVATNAAEGSRLDVRLESIPGTLLSFVPIRLVQTVAVHDHLARTGPLIRPDRRVFAPGSYRITVSENGAGKIGEREVFLGEMSVLDYGRALHHLNLNLLKQKSGELIELRQIIVNFEDQLTQTAQHFDHPRNWRSFSSRWNIFQAQLGEELRPTPAGDEDVFYQSLFIRARNLHEKIGKIHSLQTEDVEKSTENQARRLEIAEETTVTRTAIRGLRGELVLAEKSLNAERKETKK